MLVRFNDQDEFVADLARDPHAVARNLVRTTVNRQLVMEGTLTRVSIVGSAKVRSSSGSGYDPSGYDVVEYEEAAGDLWGNDAHDDDVRARAEAMATALEEKLRIAGFVVGHGRYEEER